MTNYDDNDPDEVAYRICRKFGNAAEMMRIAMIGRDKQKAYGMAHSIASSALEELDKLAVKDSLTTPMFGGE